MDEKTLLYIIEGALICLLLMGGYLCYLFGRINLQIFNHLPTQIKEIKTELKEDIQEVKKDLKEGQKNIVDRLDNLYDKKK